MLSFASRFFSNASCSSSSRPDPIESIDTEVIAAKSKLGCHDIEKIIYDYAFDKTNPTYVQQPFTFFGISSLQQQILALAEYAAPLDQIEAYIKQAYLRKEPHLQNTLLQAIRSAVIGLDHSIHNEKGEELDQGMAEKLFQLYTELFPNHTDRSKALEIICCAAPLEDDKSLQTREMANVEAVNQLFDAFVRNDAQLLQSAIETFKDFVTTLKPKILSDNQYHLNLIHLLYIAFGTLALRGMVLPKINEEDNSGWYGKLADRFCFEIIGGTIQNKLPPRTKQILSCGLHGLLQDKKKPPRVIDISGKLFAEKGSSCKLGINAYYDYIGLFPTLRKNPSRYGPGRNGYGTAFFDIYYKQFLNYFKQVHQSPTLLGQDLKIRPQSCTIL